MKVRALLQRPSEWSWLQSLVSHFFLGSHLIGIFWINFLLFKFAQMVSMRPNDSSLVHPLTPFPLPKEKHRNHVTVWLWLFPKPWNVRCPPLYQAKHSWPRTRINSRNFNYKWSETLPEGLLPVLYPLMQLTLPVSLNHDICVLSPSCQNANAEGAALLRFGLAHSVGLGSSF